MLAFFHYLMSNIVCLILTDGSVVHLMLRWVYSVSWLETNCSIKTTRLERTLLVIQAFSAVLFTFNLFSSASSVLTIKSVTSSTYRCAEDAAARIFVFTDVRRRRPSYGLVFVELMNKCAQISPEEMTENTERIPPERLN